MNRRFRPAAIAVLALLAVTACGSRANDSLREQAAQAALSQGRSGGGGATDGGATGDLGSTGATGTSGTGSGTSSTTGTATSGTGTTGSTGAGTSGAGTTGTSGFSGDNGGATDIGVTKDSITVGVIADLSGAIPGLFRGAVQGTQAYLAKVNAEGGVFGRQLKLDVRDSQLKCAQYKSQATAALTKDFALVGSFSLFDGCGADAIKADEKIADIHSALGGQAQQVPNNFSVAPLGTGWRTGPLHYYKAKFGADFGKIGTIYAAVGGGEATWRGARQAIESIGGAVAYESPYQPTDTDFTATVIRMNSAGVKMLYVVAADAAGDANLLKAVRAQGFTWPVVYGGSAYDQAFLDKAGAAAEGVWQDQQYAQFFNAADAAVIPAVKEFQTWHSRVTGGKSPDLFGAYGWSSAQLFVQALKAAGPKATRASLLTELRKITTFDANGLLAAANPAGKKPGTCWLFSTVKNNKWMRVETPANKFRCDGGYFTAT